MRSLEGAARSGALLRDPAFMTLLLNRASADGATPIHILVVVVGECVGHENLPGAERMASEIVEFWKDGQRILPDGQMLSSIRVLASDPGGPVELMDDEAAMSIARPTYEACKSALLEWSKTIDETEGVGILHWIGHGRERSFGGSVISLLCDGASASRPGMPSGLDWTKTLFYLDDKLRGRSVFCFIDACRTIDWSHWSYDGVGECGYDASENAKVFYSTPRGGRAFWVEDPKRAMVAAGGGDLALGTRAFLAALDGFGAQTSTEVLHPVLPQEIVQASTNLLSRWLVHQSLFRHGSPQGAEGPRGRVDEPILLTSCPRSVVDVQPVNAVSCEAESVASKLLVSSETDSEPFQFRLLRDPHAVIWNKSERSRPNPIYFPHVTIRR